MRHPQEDWLDEASRTESPVPAREDLRAGGRDEFVKLRLHSLDAYRGLIMVSLSFGGFGLAATAAKHLEQEPSSELWRQVEFHFEHVEWAGCGYWDLIQPSFMFMVGASAAYSYAKRKRRGHSYVRMLLHAMWRSIVLILLGIFLISNWRGSTNWSLMNVLTQIGLGYTFLFLCWGRSTRTQIEIAAVVLLGVWAAYFFYRHAGVDLQEGNPTVGVSADWAALHLTGIDEPWHKNANVGQRVDKQLLNWVPRNEPFKFDPGGYQTLNFVPSLVTMLFGLMCGELLRSSRSRSRKLMILLIAAALGIGVGWALDHFGICPLVKRIWTPSWAIYSAGWCALIMAVLFATIDMIHFRYWAIPLIIVGMNSLAVYVMSMLLKPWVANSLETHFGEQVFRLRARWGEDLYRFFFVDNSMETVIAFYEPTVRAVMIGLVFWCVALYMYRRRIFVRI
jgi:predicted acyltransferase